MARARSSSRHRQFFIVPDWINMNSQNDVVVDAVIASSFYPKLLARDGKGWRNVANNQFVSLHPTSVNKGVGSIRWLSFYHIMQSSNKWVIARADARRRSRSAGSTTLTRRVLSKSSPSLCSVAMPSSRLVKVDTNCLGQR